MPPKTFNANPYYLVTGNITFAELFELYFKVKYIDNKKKKYSKTSAASIKATFKNYSALHNKKFKTCTYDLQKRMILTDKDYSEFVQINIPNDENREPFTSEELDIL